MPGSISYLNAIVTYSSGELPATLLLCDIIILNDVLSYHLLIEAYMEKKSLLMDFLNLFKKNLQLIFKIFKKIQITLYIMTTKLMLIKSFHI